METIQAEWRPQMSFVTPGIRPSERAKIDSLLVTENMLITIQNHSI